MAKTRPGLDRIYKQELQRLATFTESRIHKHVESCITCSVAGRDVYAHCNEWWAMAKFVHRTRRKLQRYAQPETVHIDTLPGLES